MNHANVKCRKCNGDALVYASPGQVEIVCPECKLQAINGTADAVEMFYSSENSKDKTHDSVSHPPHYTKHPSGVECITVTEHFNFNRGNAIKYIWRAGEKGNEIEDLKKAAWYINREIQRLEKKA